MMMLIVDLWVLFLSCVHFQPCFIYDFRHSRDIHKKWMAISFLVILMICVSTIWYRYAEPHCKCVIIKLYIFTYFFDFKKWQLLLFFTLMVVNFVCILKMKRNLENGSNRRWGKLKSFGKLKREKYVSGISDNSS